MNSRRTFFKIVAISAAVPSGVAQAQTSAGVNGAITAINSYLLEPARFVTTGPTAQYIPMRSTLVRQLTTQESSDCGIHFFIAQA